jgi:predicted nucleic acid-binding protein
MLLDSNAIIYAVKPQFVQLRELIATHSSAVSAISYLEVLGYHRLTAADLQDFKAFFALLSMIPITQAVIEQATHLRQQRKMSVGDSIIAATAILHKLTLVTANTNDFQWIPDIQLLNPLPLANS